MALSPLLVSGILFAAGSEFFGVVISKLVWLGVPYSFMVGAGVVLFRLDEFLFYARSAHGSAGMGVSQSAAGLFGNGDVGTILRQHNSAINESLSSSG